ncbi:MAG: adenylate/guanylate cyclase domain-containing protein [Alphaproteobacteria bacterium]|jgi:adenylate cyclase|nr:adenylate/guanylate cyclase domain-containing protein [Alphaproteobacteria bacterium]MBU0802310.1 adenylate/guanylate cyclase domain-containing protein [Alphaproteobacteria bacterium]MBU0870248.1 adenylate/guanylate cyclase domain-containing protein [Alphaproteobacteria bacterium]MBU1399809.1 adenylate/guanylate cyclase domain-containing protein [Alphaproteobacteria bacterium]MBU1590195.1 adenylate/guanylate cyclase domain-containing protein [Alphaproteobacteria bacterium]
MTDAAIIPETKPWRRFVPALVAVISLLLLLPVAVMLDLKDLTAHLSRQQATDMTRIINDIRDLYARDVVGRILQAPPGVAITASDNFHDIPGAIPIPATFSLELGKLISAQDNAVRYDFVSDYAFAGRAPHELDEFQTMALAKFRADPALNVVEQTRGDLNSTVAIASPIRMTQTCVACHNSHPDSPKTDWKVGDVRGIQSVTVTQPLALSSIGVRYLFVYFALAALTGVYFVYQQWRQSRQVSALNEELKEANSFLATVSLKIAKYLSPEIYKSVFSGERDVKVTAERKKLTIFFSDIVDFTATTERMQPEELTALLNEYLTEMSRIAIAHGATVDKFIGDAILAFFGDPNTLGAAEDARACLHMANEMQDRLAELQRKWLDQGIEHPFRVRMGINTGYCNVGNFGSDDRMDYTIIGAEANLAARLQSIAPAGGIMLSYETYAHVKDFVEAQPTDPIRMKGISREVIPYLVERTSPAPAADTTLISENEDGLSLVLDMSGMDPERAARLRAKLKAALAVLDTKARQPIVPDGAPQT